MLQVARGIEVEFLAGTQAVRVSVGCSLTIQRVQNVCDFLALPPQGEKILCTA